MKRNSFKIGQSNTEDFSKDNLSPIKFKRKTMKSNMRLGSRLFVFLILSCISGVFFASIVMKAEYNKAIAAIREEAVNRGSGILSYPDIINVVSPSLVTISDSKEKLTANNYYSENSTGIIINQDGTIFTNYSKVKNLNDIYVKLAAKGTPPLKAELIGGDERIDIAIIKVDYEGDLTPIKFSDRDTMRIGEGIAIISNSIGDEYVGGVMPGIITATSKKYISSVDNIEYKLLETNAIINNENTGAALCNYKGELLGITSVDITNKQGMEGLFYAIDLGELEKIVNTSTKFKALLGITEGSVINNEDGIDSGFYISKVKKGGNAYRSGIKPTDILVEFDGIAIKNVGDVAKGLKNKKVGDTIECKVMRNGEIINVSIVLNEG